MKKLLAALIVITPLTIGGFFFQSAASHVEPRTITGRVTRNADGRGFRGARLYLDCPGAERKHAIANPFGYYRFADVPPVATCSLYFSTKENLFWFQPVPAGGDMLEVNFAVE